MRAGLAQCQMHSTVQGERLAAFPQVRRLFGILWELPGGHQRIAGLHNGFKDSKIIVHGSSTEVQGLTNVCCSALPYAWPPF